MSTSDAAVIRLIAQIQEQVLRLDNLRRRGASAAELEAWEDELERLRWRLAEAVRWAARSELGGAA
jgi:hypothetical protein